MPVAYLVRMRAREAARAALLTNSALVQAGSGNVVFPSHQGVQDPDRCWVYEAWQDADADADADDADETSAHPSWPTRSGSARWSRARRCCGVNLSPFVRQGSRLSGPRIVAEADAGTKETAP